MTEPEEGQKIEEALQEDARAVIAEDARLSDTSLVVEVFEYDERSHGLYFEVGVGGEPKPARFTVYLPEAEDVRADYFARHNPKVFKLAFRRELYRALGLKASDQ